MALQALILPASIRLQLSTRILWNAGGADAYAIDSALTFGNAENFRLNSFSISTNGQLVVNVIAVGSSDNGELSNAFEVNGGIRVTLGNESWVFLLAGFDTTEPYVWTPTNHADALAAYAAASATNTAVTFELSDNAAVDFFVQRIDLGAIEARAGNPDASFDLRILVSTIGSIEARAGNPSASFRLHALISTLGSIEARAGNPSASFDIQTFISPSAGQALLDAFSLQGKRPVYALEISHPDVPDDIRVINDNFGSIRSVVIEGNEYVSLAFRAKLPSDKDREYRHATIEVDNIGRRMVAWVEQSNGGRGATVRVMQIVNLEVVWELPVLIVGRAKLSNKILNISLSDSARNRSPGVKMRHDPANSPGLF